MSEETKWGFNGLGYVVYKRTYARPLTKGRTEEWEDTIQRVIDACDSQLKMELTRKDEKLIKSMMLNLEGTVAGRFLWQLGTSTVKKLGLASLQNCAFTTVNEPIRPFTWAMDMLMLGSGVGYNIQREYVYELPKIKRAKLIRKDSNDADFIVPDSREGWVKLLEYLLRAHFTDGKSFSYSTVCVRGKGAAIKGFGGVASGPEELCWGMGEINKLLNKRAGKKLRPIDALDIMNIIGCIVIAGNVRRSAQIAIGDADDLQFLNAKRWDLGNIPNWRAMSNNSVVCNDINNLPEQFWEGYKGNGEPYGLINLKLSREVGRLNETQYPDPNVAGFNPCAEQSLAPYETCCLAECFLPNIKSKDRFFEIIKMLYRINKHSLALKCHLPETEEIVHKHMRMGIGITGYLQATKEQKSWLKDGYAMLREFDKKYSRKHGWPESIKLTTVKPSGTLSLLAGTTPGGHPGYSHYHVRRMRLSSSHSLVPALKATGYPLEPVLKFDGTEDPQTMVASFPCKFPSHTVVAKDMSAIDQLEIVKELQSNWSDNAVSVTVYYKLEELPAIKKWLKQNYNTSTKSVSFLLHNEHGFKQAPLEEINKEEYNQLVSKVQLIKGLTKVDEDGTVLEVECEGGACPVK